MWLESMAASVLSGHVHLTPPPSLPPRENLCSILLALELHLDEIANTGEKLYTYHDIVAQLDKQADIFRDAVNTPNHPLISMQDK